MSFTEHLLPGDRADEKPAIGKNIPEIYATTAEIPPELRGPAMRAVAAQARDAQDARLLLDICGLLPATATKEADQ